MLLSKKPTAQTCDANCLESVCMLIYENGAACGELGKLGKLKSRERRREGGSSRHRGEDDRLWEGHLFAASVPSMSASMKAIKV